MGCCSSKNREDDSPPAPHPTSVLNNGNLSEFQSRSIADMDDAALGYLVDSVLQDIGGEVGTYQANEASVNAGERDQALNRQFLMASLRRGYYSTEPVAVAVGGQLDVDYGNRGPEISMEQQMTNSPYLSAVNAEELQALSGQLQEEWKALRDDDDVHSVSVISAAHDEDRDKYKPCPIDCWLKSDSIRTLEALPNLESEKQASQTLPETEPNCTGIYGTLAPSEMRVLSVEPGSYGKEIVCNLFVAGIGERSTTEESDIPYDALSYTWGNPTPKFQIHCNGRPLHIAHNLFFALQHLRHPTEPRRIWIDAICINQQDLRERSEQVQYMQQIYEHAARTIVWLGEEADDSHIAVESMKYLDNQVQREDITLRRHYTDCYSRLKGIYNAQCSLLSRPWFRRCWIRQEVSVAKEVVVICGRDTLSWYTLKRSAVRLWRNLYSKLSEEAGLNVPKFDKTQASVIECLTQGWIYGQIVTKRIGNIRSVWYYHAGGFLDLLMAGREFDATDPRDKVYSILGLCRVPMASGVSPSAAQGGGGTKTLAFPVDYSKPVSEVYQDVVKYFVNRDRNLDILAILLTTRNASSDDDLPSWTPDWRVPTSEIPLTTHWDFISAKLCAGGLNTKALVQSFDEKSVLRAQGYLVTVLVKRTDYSTTVYDMLNILRGFGVGGDAAHRRKDRRPPLSARPFDPLQHRTRCFHTRSETVCLAPAVARPGDEVAVFLGGKVLFVVRKVTMQEIQTGIVEREGTDDEGGPSAGDDVAQSQAYTCKVVGPCIVPELMFGKLITIAKDQCATPMDFVLV